MRFYAFATESQKGSRTQEAHHLQKVKVFIFNRSSNIRLHPSAYRRNRVRSFDTPHDEAQEEDEKETDADNLHTAFHIVVIHIAPLIASFTDLPSAIRRL